MGKERPERDRDKSKATQHHMVCSQLSSNPAILGDPLPREHSEVSVFPTEVPAVEGQERGLVSSSVEDSDSCTVCKH